MWLEFAGIVFKLSFWAKGVPNNSCRLIPVSVQLELRADAVLSLVSGSVSLVFVFIMCLADFEYGNRLR